MAVIGLAVLAALAGACSDADDSPSSAPTTSSVPADPTPTFTFPTRVPVPQPGPRPDRFVGVTLDGAVVVVDASSGAVVRELARASDPTVPQTGESGQYTYVRSVALSLDGATAYFGLSPEPARGSVEQVPVAGGEARSAGYGVHPGPGPDGALATSGESGLQIHSSDGAEIPLGSASYGPAAWSPDGRLVAVEEFNVDTPSDIVMFDLVAGTSAVLPDLDNYGLPVFRNDGRLVVARGGAARVVRVSDGVVVASFDYGGEVVDQAYDATGTWLLVTMADGRVRWFGGGQQGELGTGYRAAAW